MKMHHYLSLVIMLTVISTAFSWTRWTTTKIAQTTGPCQLELNAIRVSVNRYCIDVEEDAVIATRGSVNWGDPQTLEISGEFQLSRGATIRSMLLWNGQKILKAKLLDRAKADSTMDSIVNKTYRDPALIKYLGNNRYSYRIYPVAINNSRKIRVLYSIPLQAYRGQFQFALQPVFTLGAEQVPTQIPVEFTNADSTSMSYIFEHKTTKKVMQFGVTYMIPFKDFYEGDSYYYYNAVASPLIIRPDISSMFKAYSYVMETTKAAGHYALIFSSIPDSLKKIITEMVVSNYTLEAKVQTAEKAYLLNIPDNSSFSISLKSQTAWNGTISWNVYDKNGTSLIQYCQQLPPDTNQAKNALLPLLWGVKYSLVEGLGNLGGLFGFVDNKMSLLALERDTLPAAEAVLYVEKGIPPLESCEIIADTAQLKLPKESILIDVTPIIDFQKNILQYIQVSIQHGHLLVITLNQSSLSRLSIKIFDIRGRQLLSFADRMMESGTISFNLPVSMKGVFVIRVSSGTAEISKKLIIK
ncbi:T9SS type A sorting domain-containing protein [bacterium]|nr:T9SS type A sorting domain-containing protein [candidate division CSSED10-310 bacterium]